MPANTANPLPTIRTPEALRGLDALYERVTRIVDRHRPHPKRNPVHAPVQKSA